MASKQTTCTRCDAPIAQPTGRGRPRKYCAACAQLAKRENAPVYIPASSKRCGASTPTRRSWYCSTCQAEVNAEQHEKARLRDRQRTFTSNCVTCGQTFVTWHNKRRHCYNCERAIQKQAQDRNAELERLRALRCTVLGCYKKPKPLGSQLCGRHSRLAAAISDELHMPSAIGYLEVLLSDPCAYCGGSASTIDHVDPLATGGRRLLENCTAACRDCNGRKSDLQLLPALRSIVLLRTMAPLREEQASWWSMKRSRIA